MNILPEKFEQGSLHLIYNRLRASCWQVVLILKEEDAKGTSAMRLCIDGYDSSFSDISLGRQQTYGRAQAFKKHGYEVIKIA